MTCPACGIAFQASLFVQGITICPVCLRSLVGDDSGMRLATGEDTTNLSAADLATLRDLRKRSRAQAS